MSINFSSIDMQAYVDNCNRIACDRRFFIGGVGGLGNQESDFINLSDYRGVNLINSNWKISGDLERKSDTLSFTIPTRIEVDGEEPSVFSPYYQENSLLYDNENLPEGAFIRKNAKVKVQKRYGYMDEDGNFFGSKWEDEFFGFIDDINVDKDCKEVSVVVRDMMKVYSNVYKDYPLVYDTDDYNNSFYSNFEHLIHTLITFGENSPFADFYECYGYVQLLGRYSDIELHDFEYSEDSCKSVCDAIEDIISLFGGYFKMMPTARPSTSFPSYLPCKYFCNEDSDITLVPTIFVPESRIDANNYDLELKEDKFTLEFGCSDANIRTRVYLTWYNSQGVKHEMLVACGNLEQALGGGGYNGIYPTRANIDGVPPDPSGIRAFKIDLPIESPISTVENARDIAYEAVAKQSKNRGEFSVKVNMPLPCVHYGCRLKLNSKLFKDPIYCQVFGIDKGEKTTTLRVKWVDNSSPLNCRWRYRAL